MCSTPDEPANTRKYVDAAADRFLASIAGGTNSANVHGSNLMAASLLMKQSNMHMHIDLLHLKL